MSAGEPVDHLGAARHMGPSRTPSPSPSASPSARANSAAVILLVDDEPDNLDLLEAFLEPEGLGTLVRTTDSREVPALLERWCPDIVLLDLHMPHRSGFDVLDELRRRSPEDEFLPVLVLTADSTSGARERALASGAHDFLTKPLDGVEVVQRVRNLLRTRALYLQQQAARRAADEARERAVLLANASRALGASLDSATALEQLERLLVPDFADECLTHLDASAEEPDRPGDDAPCTLRVALDSGGARLGWLELRRRSGRPPFSPPEVDLARELAHRAARALEHARLLADAQAAARARDLVLAVVAHDLRNPLAALAAEAEMLEHLLPPDAPQRQRSATGRIRRVAERLERHMQDLLDVTRLEGGGLPLRPCAVPVATLVQQATELLEPLARARGVRLTFDGPADLPPVHADAGRVLQVFSNIVGNALRFTPEGGSVRVTWRRAESDVAFEVTDEGPGIAPELLPHVFAPFWQADAAERRGAGLGLAIARALVAGHGGRIWVDSVPGAGATFHFTFPLEETQS